MQKTSIFILYLLGNFGIYFCKPDYYFLIDRLESIPGEETTLVDYSQCRLERHERGGEYFVNGNLTYYADLGEDIMHTVKTAYSSTGSSQFCTHPYTVQKSTICEFFKTFYRKYGQPWVEGHSDFPNIPEEGLCPLPKGTYYIKNVSLDENKLPDHAPSGLWKIEQLFEKDGKIVGGMRIIANVIPKYD